MRDKNVNALQTAFTTVPISNQHRAPTTAIMFNSSYDPSEKIWSGLKQPGPFNPQANLGQLILNVLERSPTMVAQICVESGVELTCEEIRLRSIRAAQNLVKLGCMKGDTIGFAVRNRENVAPIVYGCLLIGTPVNCIDPDFTAADMAYMLRISKPVLVVADEANVETVKVGCQAAGINPKFVVMDRAPGKDNLSTCDVVKETGNEQFFYPLYLGDSKKLIAAVVFSSGTTGMPKGICLSHANIIHQNALICNSNIHKFKTAFMFSSLFWISGLLQLVRGPFNNSTRYISTRQFSPETFFEIVEKYALTHVFSSPAQMALILQSPLLEEANLSSIKFYYCGGGMASSGLRKSIEKWLPSGRTGVAYGTSEIGHIATDAFGPAREGSVGVLVPNIEAKVLDDIGNQMDVNERGVLWFRYPIRPMGYLNNQAATDEILTADGWVCSGDVGYFDEDNYLYLVDRQKEIIKYKSYQISPVEIEATIEELPEVALACVVGLFDPVLHTDITTAVVQLRKDYQLSEARVIEHVAEKLAHYKHLRGGVLFVDELPMTMSGKLQRHQIRKYVKQRKGL